MAQRQFFLGLHVHLRLFAGHVLLHHAVALLNDEGGIQYLCGVAIEAYVAHDAGAVVGEPKEILSLVGDGHSLGDGQHAAE